MNRLFKYLAIHHYAVLNELIRLVASALYQKISPAHPLQKILIVRKGTLGDHLCSLPAINDLKMMYSGASFQLLTYSNNQPGISIQSLVDTGYFEQVYDLDKSKPEKLRQLLREQHFDAVIEIPQNLDTMYTQLRNMIFYRLAGIKQGAGWAISNTLFLKKYQNRWIAFDNEQSRIQKILHTYGLETSVNLPANLLKLETIDLPFNFYDYIVVAVGAKHQAKRWPVSYFKELVFSLVEQGHRIILVGDVADKKQTAGWLHERVFNLCGETNIGQSAFVMKHALLTVCNDSGPMHLSYNMGTLVIALFSARGYKGKWFPPADGKNKVLGNFDVPCAVCFLSECNHHICMERISVKDVLTSIDEVLTPVHI